MSHFYGTVKGNRGEGSRAGHKNSGIETYAASYAGSIRVHLFHHNDQDHFDISQERWHGSGISEFIAKGIVGQSIAQPEQPELLQALAVGGEVRKLVDAMADALRLVAELAHNSTHGMLNPTSAVEPILKASQAALAEYRKAIDQKEVA